MITGTEVNADLTAHVVVKAEELEWRETEHRGVFIKDFERITDSGKARETYLMRLDPGAALPETALDERTEMMVLEGEISDGSGTHGAGVYVMNPPGARVRFASETGGTAFMKRRARAGSGAERVVRRHQSG